MINCPYCKKEMCWQTDFDSEDLEYEEKGILSLWLCLDESCGCEIQIFKPEREEKE